MEMNNLQNYTQFNEGLRKWVNSKIENMSYDSTLSDILKNNIKPNFRFNRLTAGYTPGESQDRGYTYKDDNYEIEVIAGGGEYNTPPRMFLNGDPITTKVSKKIIMDYYNYFDKMYNDKFDSLDNKSDDFYHGGLN